MKPTYYKSDCGKLIKHFTDKNLFIITNDVKLNNKEISKEDFQKLQTIQIKNQKFSKLMNDYFKTVKESWTFNGKNYRNLDSENFKDAPRHDAKSLGCSWYGWLYIVYHWGKIYYFQPNHNGKSGQGQLIDTRTKNVVRWANLKNCSPVFDTDLKQII